MLRRLSPRGSFRLLRDPERGVPDPQLTAAWTTLALGFTTVIVLVVGDVSELVLAPVAWAVAALATAIVRRVNDSY